MATFMRQAAMFFQELSPLPVRKSWNVLESTAKTYVKKLLKVSRPLTVEDFSLVDWTHGKVFPVA